MSSKNYEANGYGHDCVFHVVQEVGVNIKMFG